jgi:secreted PhoX family phosphatase
MTKVSRRGFIAGGAAVAAGVSLAGPFEGLVAHAAMPAGRRRSDGYGPLSPTADERDGTVRLDLPDGFSYRTFHTTGTALSDGTTVPARPDGMAAFRGRHGNSILVRNHEINGPGTPIGGNGALYDPMTRGGTVTVEVDPHGNVIAGSDYVSLQGSQNNCAGGRTGWNSWLTCEETVNGDDVGNDFTGQSNAGLLKHGYMFEVPSDGTSNAVPIRSAGRFAHEAAAVTPSGDAVYLTEDNFGFASGFYRYLPPQRGRRRSGIADGGVLQMLKVVGVDNADLSLGQAPGATYDVEWVDIADPDPTFPAGTTNDEAIVAVGDQGRALGAAIFSRLEGAYYSNGQVYFISTQGGATNPPDSDPSGFGGGRGQVWVYKPGPDRLSLVFESPGSSTLDLPDNVVVSKHGSLVLCEDGSGDNFLRGLTRNGQVFAGATFSHTGSTMYVNIQSSRPSYSIAIWGPWHKGPF